MNERITITRKEVEENTDRIFSRLIKVENNPTEFKMALEEICQKETTEKKSEKWRQNVRKYGLNAAYGIYRKSLKSRGSQNHDTYCIEASRYSDTPSVIEYAPATRLMKDWNEEDE